MRVKPSERITQRSIGFNFRQIAFFNWCDMNGVKFKPDEHARYAVDEQIKEYSKIYEEVKQFLKEEDEKKTE